MTEDSRKMSRRSFLKYAAAGVAAVAVAGGGYSYYASTLAPKEVIPTSEVKGKILYWSWDTTDVGIVDIKDRISRFTDTYPGTSIELVTIPLADINKKLAAAITAKKGMPDVAEVNGPNVMPYAAMGALVPVDEYLNTWRTPGRGSNAPFLKDDYTAVLDYCEYKDHYYGFPISQGCMTVVVHKDMVRQAGFKIPGLDTPNNKHDGTDDTWTWEQYREVRRALTDKSKDVWGGGGSGLTPHWHLWSMLCYQQDLKIIFPEPKGSDKYALDFDSDRGVAVMEEIADEFQNTLPKGAVNWEQTDYQNMMQAKKLACYVSNPEPFQSVMAQTERKFPGVSIPPLRGKVKASKSGNRNLCIFQSPEVNLRASLAWCRYYLGIQEYKGKVYNYAYNILHLPVLKSDLKDPKYMENLKDDLPYYYGVIDGSAVGRAMPKHVNWAKISTAAAKYCEKAAIGELSPEKANRALVDETWQYLKQT